MLALAAAAIVSANTITAPFGLWGRAEWAAVRPNVQLTLENRSEVKAWLVDVACNAYDRKGALVGVATANLAQLEPGQRMRTWAIGEAAPAAHHFACKVAVNEWRKPAAKAAKTAASRPASPARRDPAPQPAP